MQKLLAIFAACIIIAVWVVGYLRKQLVLYSLIAVAGGLLIAHWFGSEYIRRAVPPEEFAVQTFGSERIDEIRLGTCQVSIPKLHTFGELESPSLLKLEFIEDPKRHIILQATSELNEAEFYDQLHAELDSKGDSVLVFIHGYNVSFEDAARRTAQMAYDLNFPGAPIFYSWPSHNNWYRYREDRKNIELSVPHIQQFLLDIAEKSGAEQIHLIAHSMGNVGLTEALAEMQATSQPKFDQVVLAAPDIDQDIFEQRIAPKIVGKADRFTLYTSRTDLALVASRYFNAGHRIGGAEITDLDGFDVVDASAVDTSLLGHSYYGGLSVLNDLSELFLNQPLETRSQIRTRSLEGLMQNFIDVPNVASQDRALRR